MSDMKNVAIITIFDLNNYGNRLQNYAMDRLLNKFGVKVITVITPKYDAMFKYSDKIGHLIKRLYAKVKKDNLIISRYVKFLDFQKNIKSIVADPKVIENNIDLFVVGSDQVWHPEVVSDDFMLKFTSAYKRASVSASFGVSEINDSKLKEYYKSSIEKIKYLSVREESGKAIIQELTNSKVVVLLDPVFMLKQEEWDRLEKKEIKLPPQYIVKYMLGEENEHYNKAIQKIADENNLEIIDVYNRDSKYFNMGPAEFVSAIKRATLVCTNSFHALAFSIIYKKCFVAFERDENNNDMNSRMNLLLDMFKLNSRKINNIEDNAEKLFECDFCDVDDVITYEQDKFRDFIKNMIE